MSEGHAQCIVPEEVLKKVLKAAMMTGADFAEVFIEDTSTETITMEDGRIENVNSGRDRGAGVRVIKGETSSYCFTDSLEEKDLLQAARTAAGALSGARGDYTIDLTRREVPVISPIAKYPWETTKAVKAEFLLRADRAARAYDPLIRQVTGALLEIVRNSQLGRHLGCRLGGPLQVHCFGSGRQDRCLADRVSHHRENPRPGDPGHQDSRRTRERRRETGYCQRTRISCPLRSYDGSHDQRLGWRPVP